MIPFEQKICLSWLLEWICLDPAYIYGFEKASGTELCEMFI